MVLLTESAQSITSVLQVDQTFPRQETQAKPAGIGSEVRTREETIVH